MTTVPSLEIPDNKAIVDKFVQETGLSIETVANSIALAYLEEHDNSIVRSLICSAYAMGYRDGGIQAFDKAEEILSNPQESST